MSTLIRIWIAIAAIQHVRGQDCPDGWQLYNNKCWYFSHLQPKLSWYAAESWCQQNNGNLASFATVDERDWVVQQNLKQWDDPRWWIGLNDNEKESVFVWSDGTPYDANVSNWKPLEPNNAYLENCVEVWIQTINDEQWNDRTCEGINNYVCKRDPGTFSECPSDYQSVGGRCYRVIYESYQWFDAQQKCKTEGANLVSLGSSTEENTVKSLISTSSYNFWVGLSDTGSPGTWQWVDGTSYSYRNWASGQPVDDLPYQGSSCADLNKDLGYQWEVTKCSVEKTFICERGFKGDCPSGWLYSSASQKCYEFVVNPNRVQTWTNAKKICSDTGGGLLKITSQEEETFIGSTLQGYTFNGHTLVYMGASDLGHDNTVTWWDQTSIEMKFWNDQQPQLITGRDDCVALYTGKSNRNWETTNCFEQRAYICELPEGQEIPSVPVVTVEGRCDENWRHYGIKKKCYYFGKEEMSQSQAEAYCVGQNAHLTSILDEDEMSFLVGHLQQSSWIGLSVQTTMWIDGEAVTFTNWAVNEPSASDSCSYVTSSGMWFGTSCSQQATVSSYVCKKDEIPTDTATVPPPTYEPDVEKCGGNGWISNPASDRCYKIKEDLRSWQDASYACQIEGGNLASVNTPEESEYIRKLIAYIPTYTDFWIGGTDQNSYNIELLDQGWRWSDESPFNYLNWANDEPNNQDVEDCLVVFTGGKWNDDDCFQFYRSICEKIGNMDNIVGPDVADENCQSNEACCFKHLGAEYGGPLPDTALTASSERDIWFNASRGRLNTPADVIITDVENEIYFGNGHGAWSPKFDDPNKWLQVDLASRSEVKGIITQGRNGIIQYSERQWVMSFKVSYSQDSDGGKWEFISDSDGQPIIFKGNSDQNTQVTNLFPRPVIAKHVRCHPVTWFDAPCMRLEYIGCSASCLYKLGMSSGLIPDGMITASSYQNGCEPKQARAPVDQDECLQNSQDNGQNYRGWISKTKSGLTCQAWSEQTPHRHDYSPSNYPTADLRYNYCRNPDGRSSPWCFTTDPNVETEECDIPICPAYIPSGWIPSTTSSAQFLQVQFSDFFKLSGVTLYRSSSSTSYVTSYYMSFSDDGNLYSTYQDQSGNNNLFAGLDSTVTEYMDVLREPITTKYVRISPYTWQNQPLLQFEVDGCYADNRITCSGSAEIWRNVEETSFSVDCPMGCVEDVSRGLVYGTDTYTLHSAVCPAAIHAGKILNNHGGSVIVQKKEGLSSYTGSTRNDITSQSFGPYSASFLFSGDSLRCDDGWLAWQNHCYYLSMKGVKKAWHDARSDCLNRGGDLVSILTAGENSFVEASVYTADLGGDVWIGLNDLDIENYYQWSDGSPVTMTKWFWDEPKTGKHRCVNIYRFEAYWNDKDCDETLPFMCKKEKQLLPPPPTDTPIQDEGCDVGWRAYGSSCYKASTDTYMFIYANRICEESGSKLVSIHDDFEQAFVFSLVLNTIPSGLGYTSWIGLSAKTAVDGTLYYEWENEEPVTYTHWDKGEPDVRFSCAFPFQYKGTLYYECTTYDHPARLENTPWCSIDPVYQGRWINCDTGYEYGCTIMDDQTGFWQIEICGDDRYYVCEKPRAGFTQPITTTPITSLPCPDGWYGDEQTTACYQINEKTEEERHERLSWFNAIEYCRAQGADLVSIHNYVEEQKVISFVSTEAVYSYTYFWMGLTSLDSEGGYTWTDGTAVGYTNWAYGEPNDHNGNEQCVENSFTYSGSWNDMNCDAVRNWICEIPKGTDPLPPPTFPPPPGTISPECGTDGTWIRFMASNGLDKCYQFVDDNKRGWDGAKRNCTERGGGLVSIHSNEENQFILAWAARSTAPTMWIGLKDVSAQAGRSFQWTDGSLLDFENWGNGEPNNYQDQEDCVEIKADDGLWNDENCGIENNFICEKFLGADTVTIPPTQPAVGGCPEGFVPYGNKCYMFSGGTAMASWYDVIDLCANKSSFPATIQNSYEQAFVTSQLRWIARNVWIGLSARNTGEYVWHDQSELTYTNWEDSEPNGYYETDQCVEIESDSDVAGRWLDNYCYDLRNYACYTGRSASYPDTTTPSTSCPYGYYAYADACYKVMDVAYSRGQAQAACQAEGGNVFLLSVNDVYENNLIKSWFWRDIMAADSIWTGLTIITETAVGNGSGNVVFEWDNGWPVDYTNWAAGEPDPQVMASGSGCVTLNNQGFWVAVSSDSCQSMSYPFVCKQSLVSAPTSPDPGAGNCDPGFIAYGQSCYYIETGEDYTKLRSWHEAKYECSLRGASLASFHSEDESLAILKAVDGNSYYDLFIGLHSDGYSGWQWDDGTAVDFLYWVPGEPNGQEGDEDCVEMYTSSGLWNDVDCFTDNGYICKKSKAFSSCGNVDPDLRIECGFVGIQEAVCLQRQCCWDSLYSNSNFSGCYYPAGVGPSGIPITEAPVSGSGGLSVGEIVGIVVGVLGFIAIVAGIAIYFLRAPDKIKAVRMPSFTSHEKKNDPQGFDNPVTTMDNETDA